MLKSARKTISRSSSRLAMRRSESWRGYISWSISRSSVRKTNAIDSSKFPLDARGSSGHEQSLRHRPARAARFGDPLRVAIANSSHRLVGGVETYLHQVAPGLLRHGCEIAFFAEAHGLGNRPEIISADDVPTWCIAELGWSAAFSALRKWRPDVIYVHGIYDIAVEGELLAIAPAVFYAHGYTGVCISGRKSFRTPTIEPCARRFGPACLAYYYARRCGGLNPMTMWQDYREQEARLNNLHCYRAILTASEHMRREYLKHDLASDAVHLLRLPISEHKAVAPSSRTA